MARKTAKKKIATPVPVGMVWPEGFSPETHIAPPAVMAEVRRRWVEGALVPWAQRVFELNQKIQSGVMFVAQYWNDEANDAVHYHFAFHSIPVPPFDYHDEYQQDVPAHAVTSVAWPRPPNMNWGDGLDWTENTHAIPLFAAFCNENGSQDDDDGRGQEPMYILRREAGGNVSVEAAQKTPKRPWLDGAKGEWLRSDEDDGGDEDGALPKGAWLGEYAGMLSPIVIDPKTADRYEEAGVDVLRVRDACIVDPWIVRALGVADEEYVLRAVRDARAREQINALLKLGAKVRP